MQRSDKKKVLHIHVSLVMLKPILKSLKLTSNQNKMNCELMLTYDTPALRQTYNM
jgi:hypothetical protein